MQMADSGTEGSCDILVLTCRKRCPWEGGLEPDHVGPWDDVWGKGLS